MLADVRCPKCGHIYEDKVIFNPEEEKVLCAECIDIECEILPNFSSHFKLKYDNKKDICSWSTEGYSKSQYYKEYDKQAKGNVFPVTGRK